MNERIPEHGSEGGTFPVQTAASGVRPYVKPGQPLGYRQRLQARQAWPPPKRVRQGPTLTPYLVIPAFEGDTGITPGWRSWGEWGGWVASQPPGTLFVDPGRILNFWGVRGTQSGLDFAIQCYVHNLGPMASYGGLAVFYVGQGSAAAAAPPLPVHVNLPTSWTPIGYAGFTAMPGVNVTVDCPHHWHANSPADVQNAVFLVQAYDPFIDALRSPPDPVNDRHVGIAWAIPPVVNIPGGGGGP